MPPKSFAQNSNFHKVIFDPNDSRPDYIGGHQRYDADSTATDWEVIAFTYDTSSSDSTVFRKRSGAFSDRAVLLP